MEQRQSEIIGTRIDEARAELVGVQQQLAALPPQRARILSADQLDRVAMKKLDALQTDLSLELEFLKRRLDVLVNQKKQAEREEAQARLDSFPALAEDLVKQAQAATAAFDEAVTLLLEKARGLAQLHKAHYLLASEGAFLAESYPGITRHPLPSIGEMPILDKLTADIGALFRFDQQENPWTMRRQQRSEERATRRAA